MNTKNLIVAVFAAILVIGGVYYFGQQYYSAPTEKTNNAVSKESNSVSIENFSFNPSTITVKAGTTVVWTNNDSASHTIKSDTFNSSTLSKGASFDYKFDNKGSYDYSCGIHPNMKGKVIVE